MHQQNDISTLVYSYVFQRVYIPLSVTLDFSAKSMSYSYDQDIPFSGSSYNGMIGLAYKS